MSVHETTALAVAGVDPAGPAGPAVNLRRRVLEMTQEAEDAVLRPRAPGSWPHALRAALAARIAALNGDGALARHYAAGAEHFAAVADPDEDGAARGLGPVLAFVDKVASRTRDVGAEDIAALQASGVSDADIVRLSELDAFVSYQVRLIAGLRLMAGETP